MYRVNPVLKKIRSGQIAFGIWLRSECCAVVESLEGSGIEFIVVDFEHNWPDPGNLLNIVRAAESVGIAAAARVYGWNELIVKRLLNIGFTGLHLAHIDSADEAKRVVRIAKYAPMGERGYAHVHRGTHYGFLSPTKYREWSNNETYLAAMIESASGLKNVREIAAVDGIDVLQIGPNDLAVSLGIPGQTTSPRIAEACKEIVEAATLAGKVAGRTANSVTAGKQYLADGFKYIPLGSDLQFLGESVRNLVANLSEKK